MSVCGWSAIQISQPIKSLPIRPLRLSTAPLVYSTGCMTAQPEISRCFSIPPASRRLPPVPSIQPAAQHARCAHAAVLLPPTQLELLRDFRRPEMNSQIMPSAAAMISFSARLRRQQSAVFPLILASALLRPAGRCRRYFLRESDNGTIGSLKNRQNGRDDAIASHGCCHGSSEHFSKGTTAQAPRNFLRRNICQPYLRQFRQPRQIAVRPRRSGNSAPHTSAFCNIRRQPHNAMKTPPFIFAAFRACVAEAARGPACSASRHGART